MRLCVRTQSHNNIDCHLFIFVNYILNVHWFYNHLFPEHSEQEQHYTLEPLKQYGKSMRFRSAPLQFEFFSI